MLPALARRFERFLLVDPQREAGVDKPERSEVGEKRVGASPLTGFGEQPRHVGVRRDWLEPRITGDGPVFAEQAAALLLDSVVPDRERRFVVADVLLAEAVEDR